MSWPEIQSAKKDSRHELILSGPAITERILQTGLDPVLFTLTNLNYLNIHDITLAKIPDEISKLVNLQTLVLHSNRLESITPKIALLEKLKVLDLFRNELIRIPDEFGNLQQLTTLNLSSNHLETFPTFVKCTKLQVLDLSDNLLTEFPDVCYAELSSFTDLKLMRNKIEQIPPEIKNLIALKNFDVSGNRIANVPGELADCAKLKELNLKDNPIVDRRFFKLIDQCRTKQVLDYVKQNCKKTDSKTIAAKKGKKGKKEVGDNLNVEVDEDERLKIRVGHCKAETCNIIVHEDVRKVRGYILACLLHNIDFTDETFKKFIQIQTRLHDGLCEKRNAATIATHDAKKLGPGHLLYTAVPAESLKIQPLNRTKLMTGVELFARLQTEAETLRKEKKRNVYSGIHKYLYLLEGQKSYPCLMNTNNDVISFPPITNSEITKISLESTTIFVEVTSATSYGVCKKVLDTLLRETTFLFDKDLVVEQIKNTDPEGNMKSIYPSKMDLIFDDNKITVIRE